MSKSLLGSVRWSMPLVLALGCGDQHGGGGPTTERVLAPASEALPIEFTAILSVRELSTGQVLISDPRENLIVLADFRTGEGLAIGGIGDGPTEYRQAGRLWPVGGDSTIMPDRYARRWLVFEGSRVAGTVSSDEPAVRESSGGRVLGMDQRGNIVARVTRWETSGRVTPNDSLSIVRIDRSSGAGEVIGRSAQVAPLAVAGSPSGGMPPERPRYMMSLNTIDQAAVFADGWVAIVRSDPFRVDWCPLGRSCTEGPSLLSSPKTFTDGDKAALLAVAQATAGWPPTTNIEETVGWPEMIPAFVAPRDVEGTSAFALPDGRLLVRRVQTLAEPGNRYDIIDRDGEIDERLQLGPNQEVVGFAGNYAYVAVTDDLGVKRLQRHPWP